MARLPCLWLGACAPIRWEVGVGPCCLSTPFLWCLPKETVSSRQRKALFYLGGSTIRVSAAASVVVTHLRPTWGGAGAGFWAHRAFESFARLFKGGGVQGRSPCPRSAERGTLLVLHKAQEGVQGGTLAGGSPFYFTLLRVRRFIGRWSLAPAAFRPHFFGQAPKKWGRIAGQANDHRPIKRRTRRNVNKRGNPRRGFPLGPPPALL